MLRSLLLSRHPRQQPLPLQTTLLQAAWQVQLMLPPWWVVTTRVRYLVSAIESVVRCCLPAMVAVAQDQAVAGSIITMGSAWSVERLGATSCPPIFQTKSALHLLLLPPLLPLALAPMRVLALMMHQLPQLLVPSRLLLLLQLPVHPNPLLHLLQAASLLLSSKPLGYHCHRPPQPQPWLLHPLSLPFPLLPPLPVSFP